MARYGKTNVGAARQFLADVGIQFDKPLGKLSDAYVIRNANAIGRQVAAGLQPNRQAARGHITTPEHGQGTTAPQVERSYRVARSSGITPNVKRGVTSYANGTREYVGGRTFAREAIRDAASLDKRVQVRVFNKQTGQWKVAYENRGHTPGISASELQDRAKANGRTIEQQVIADAVRGSDSEAITAADLEALAELLEQAAAGDVDLEEDYNLNDYSLWEVNVM